MQHVIRALTPFGLSLLTSLLTILAFQDFNLWYLAWLSLTPLLVVVGAWPLTVKKSFLYGLLAGSLFFYGSCYWITYPMIHYGALASWLAYGLAAIPVIVSGAFWGGVTAGLRLAILRCGRGGYCLAPPLWVVMEWLRLQVTGMGWNALGYSQAFAPATVQYARWTGVYGVIFILVMSATLLAVLLLVASKRQLSRRWWKLVACIFALVLAMIWTSWRSRPPACLQERGLRIVAVQPNTDVRSFADPIALQASFEQLLALTYQAISSDDLSQADLVIWPESPIAISPIYTPQLWQQTRQFVQRFGVHLLLNLIGHTPPDQIHNSVAVLAPDGTLLSEYRKLRLMPFGEYVPLRGVLLWLDRVSALVGDFTPGHEFTLTPLARDRVGSFICSESAEPRIARQLTRRGATVLVEVTNDAWFGPTAGANQHLAHAIFRAVENGRPLVRVTNSGVTVLIEPDGRLIEPTGVFQTAFRRWTIDSSAVAATQTFYTRWGDWFVIACGFGCLIILLRRTRMKPSGG